MEDEQGNNKINTGADANQGDSNGQQGGDKAAGPVIPSLFSARRPLTTGNLPAVKRPEKTNNDDPPTAPKGPALPSLFNKKGGASGTMRMHAVSPPGSSEGSGAPSPKPSLPSFGAKPAPTSDGEQPPVDAPDTIEAPEEAQTQEQEPATEEQAATPDTHDDLPGLIEADNASTTLGRPNTGLALQGPEAHVFGDPEQMEEADDGDGGPSTDVLSADDVDPSWGEMEPEWSDAIESAGPPTAEEDPQEEHLVEDSEPVFEQEQDDSPTQVVNPEDVLDALEPAPEPAPAPVNQPSSSISTMSGFNAHVSKSASSNPFMGSGGFSAPAAVADPPAADEAATNDFPGAANMPTGLEESTQSEDAHMLDLDEVSIVEDEEDHTAIDMDRAEILSHLNANREVPEHIDNNDFEEEGATQVFNSGVGPAPTAPGLEGVGQNAKPKFEIQQPQVQSPPGYGQPQQPSPAGFQQQQPQQPQYAPAAEAAAPVDDFDDEFTAQKTELIQSPFERDLVAPKLRAVEGPTAGQEYFVNGLRVTVGRGENSSVMIADIAMSRTHFELIKNSDDSFVIRDMESANGTLLNGAQIREASLFHGDRIEVGKTILEFEHENAPPRPNRHLIPAAGVTMTGAENPLEFDDKTNLVAMQLDQSTRFFTNVSLFAGVLCIPLCILLVVVSSGFGSDEPQETTEEPVEVVEPAKNEAAESYLKGVEAVRNREWEQAREHFELAHKSDDQVDITAQIKRIDAEIGAKKLLDEASVAAKGGDEEKVLSIISKIPEESVYHDEAQRLTRDKRRDEVNGLYAQAQQQLTEDKLEEAEKTIASIKEIVPDHAGATELTERIEARKAELEEIKRKEELAAKQDDKKGPGIKFDDPFSNSGSKKTSNSSSLSTGYGHYKRKRFAQAISFFEGKGSKGKKLAGDVRTVESDWASGSKAAKAKQWSRAVSKLEKARRADGNLGKHHRSAISSELADAYGGKGLDQLKKKDYINARKSLTKGQKLGKSSMLTDLARGLEREATSLYIKAANKKKTDPTEAAKICRTIMRMVPSSSTNFKKAKRLILEL